MAYVCIHCGREIKNLEKNFIMCPYCNYRVLAKKRSAIAKEISSD